MKVKLVSMIVLLALLLSAVSSVALAQEPPPPVPDVHPLAGWFTASRWETPWVGGRPHKLAVWTHSYCGSQQYNGPGGYGDTCSSSHGCIDRWTWWIYYPEAKLGVPF